MACKNEKQSSRGKILKLKNLSPHNCYEKYKRIPENFFDGIYILVFRKYQEHLKSGIFFK